MSDFFIKPKTGITVRDPVTMKPLAMDGETKPRNGYWLRRVREQSVDIALPDTAGESGDAKASVKSSKRRNSE